MDSTTSTICAACQCEVRRSSTNRARAIIGSHRYMCCEDCAKELKHHVDEARRLIALVGAKIKL